MCDADKKNIVLIVASVGLALILLVGDFIICKTGRVELLIDLAVLMPVWASTCIAVAYIWLGKGDKILGKEEQKWKE